MGTPDDKIREFIIARKGEVEGLEDVLGFLNGRSSDLKHNVESIQKSSVSILAALDRINIAIDSQLLRVDTASGETLVQQLLDAIAEIRRAVRAEEQATVREFGFAYGSLNTVNETFKTLNEKLESAKTAVKNQKDLLDRSVEGDHKARDVGERPISLKEQRKFEEIVSNEEKSE